MKKAGSILFALLVVALLGYVVCEEVERYRTLERLEKSTAETARKAHAVCLGMTDLCARITKSSCGSCP